MLTDYNNIWLILIITREKIEVIKLIKIKKYDKNMIIFKQFNKNDERNKKAVIK